MELEYMENFKYLPKKLQGLGKENYKMEEKLNHGRETNIILI